MTEIRSGKLRNVLVMQIGGRAKTLHRELAEARTTEPIRDARALCSAIHIFCKREAGLHSAVPGLCRILRRTAAGIPPGDLAETPLIEGYRAADEAAKIGALAEILEVTGY